MPGKVLKGKGKGTNKDTSREVPPLSEKSKQIIAIVVSDLHLSEKPPVFRSTALDWMGVQEGYMGVLRYLQIQHGGVPILIAGDVFDKWNSSPLLIGKAIGWLQRMNVYSIPGNHDLPGHSYQQLPRSAYWCLHEAGVIKNLEPGGTHEIGQMLVHPFPPGFEVTPPNKGNDLCLHVALIHDYIWTERTGYEGAAESKRLAGWSQKLRGYNVALFGDNHKSVLATTKYGTEVFNAGTFMRRKSDEKELRVCVGLLHSDGQIERYYLDTSADKFLDPGEEIKGLESLNVDMSYFVQELESLHAEKMDYVKAVLRYMQKFKTPSEIRTLVCRALGVSK